MREIKFRFIDRKTNKIVAYATLDDLLKKIWYDPYIYAKERVVRFTSDKYIHSQYTGLRDRNKKEIYEGDIVKVTEEDGTEHIHYVEYKADKIEYPAFDLYPEIDVEFNALQFYVINKQIEIIGNIHQNPELLEEHNV